MVHPLHKTQIPPDLVVKSQAADIIDLILSLIRRKTSSKHRVDQGNRALSCSHYLRVIDLPHNSGGVSNVDIDGNNALQIKAIGVVISTFETLPKILTPLV